MKKIIKPFMVALCGMFLITPIVKAQEATIIPTVSLGENVTMKIGGFLRADAYFDTRKNEELVDGLFNFFPLNESLDKSSSLKDFNAIPQFRMAATASRLNARFTGPDVLNAKSSAFVEFDFTGVNGIGLRLRHAWIKLNWEKSELLFGRSWHPLMALDVLPNVVALSTGAPFTVFNRCEQFRYTLKFGQLSTFAAISTQMKYGFPVHELTPGGTKEPFQTQLIPDLTYNIQYKSDLVIVGATGNYKINRPIVEIPYGKDRRYRIDDDVRSLAVAGYAQIAVGDFKIKGGAMYGQNMHELLMLGGYAIESVSADSTSIKYTTANNMNYWGNIIYGKDLQFSLFFGYTQNLGTAAKTIAPIKNVYFGRGESIANLMRIAPSISYKTGRSLFQLEVEQNIAAYGTVSTANIRNEYNEVKNTKNISNTRVQLTATFFF